MKRHAAHASYPTVSDENYFLNGLAFLTQHMVFAIDDELRRIREQVMDGAVQFVGSRFSGPELYLEANGATKVTFEGNVNALSAEMNGASRLDAESLVTRAMELSISGAGRAEVHVTEVLRVEIAGAGKVIYSGEPKTVTREISGAGSVRKRG
jgi:hypothetical protein